MVIGAEHDDVALEAPLALVEVVREVAGDVGRLAVALDDDAVAVVAELCGAQPGGPVGLEDVTEFAQAGDGVLDSAGLIEVVLVEVHVEVDPEVVEAGTDVAEHQLDTDRAKSLLQLVGGQHTEIARVVGHHSRRNFADVEAAVAVFRRGLARVAGDQAAREAVDLRPVVVEVVLAGDDAALRLEDACEAVSDGGPTNAADVDRAGGVRRDELEVDGHPVIEIAAAVLFGLGDDRASEGTRGCRIEGDVDETGASHIHCLDSVDARDHGGDLGRELARVRPEPLGELHGDVGRPVAVCAILRPLECNIVDADHEL